MPSLLTRNTPRSAVGPIGTEHAADLPSPCPPGRRKQEVGFLSKRWNPADRCMEPGAKVKHSSLF